MRGISQIGGQIECKCFQGQSMGCEGLKNILGIGERAGLFY